MQQEKLSQRILTYDDVVKAKPGTSTEPLVDVRTYDPTIVALYDKKDMQAYAGDRIFVRDTVAKKLQAINDELKPRGLCLKVVYGYRHPEVQQNYFIRRKQELAKEFPELDDKSLDRLTHNFVAIPDVAGHPTGGAVDMTIIDGHGELDMGTAIADYSDPHMIQTFDPRITKSQAEHRQLLCKLAIMQGFAPFYGEWWHFSYGDREWATFYDRPQAIYNVIRDI